MSQQIIKDHNLEALKEAASWPGADRVSLITLATVLAATGADHDGLSYFGALAASQPGEDVQHGGQPGVITGEAVRNGAQGLRL